MYGHQKNIQNIQTKGGKMKFIEKTSYAIVAILTTFLYLLLITLTFTYVKKEINNHILYVLVIGILFSFLVFAIVYFTRNIPTKIFLSSFLIMLLVLQLVYIFKFNVKPISDFSYMLNAAQNIVAGKPEIVKNDDYFFWYTTQLGYPIFESLILKIGDGSVYSLQFVNLIFIDSSVLMIYFLSQKVFNSFSGRIAFLGYGGYMGLFLFSSVLSNQHGGLFFILSSMMIFISDYDSIIPKNIFCGVLLGIGNIFYPIGILFLLGLLFYQIFLDKKGIKDKLKSVIFILVGYYVPIILVSFYIIITGLSVHGINHFDNNWKFVLGLNRKTNGQYSIEDFNHLKDSYLTRNESLHNKLEKAMIEERSNAKGLLRLFINKSINIWAAADDSYNYTLLPPYGSKNPLNHFTVIVSFAQYISFYITGFLASVGNLIFNIKRKERDHNIFSLFGMILIGGFLIYLVIEQQVRYRYFFTPIFVIISSGLPYYFTKFKRRNYGS